MIKVLVIFAIVLVVSVQANQRCRQVCKPRVHSRAVCASDGQQKICQRISQCKMEEENCRRRSSRRPILSNVAAVRCRNIKRPNGSGPCAKFIRKPRNALLKCSILDCLLTSRQLRCCSSKRNNCQLLNECDLRRANCRRSPTDQLTVTDARRCNGMRAREPLRPCKFF